MTIEQEIKNQYAKLFKEEDWRPFKIMADYYFKTAANLKKKDIEIHEYIKLMGRNIQKRLYLGIGAELLLKSLYLKNNYCINKVKRGVKNPGKPKKYFDVSIEDYDERDTYTLGSLIDNLKEIIECDSNLLKGLKIAKVFRNKEGHVATLWHSYKEENYSDIEYSIKEVYKKGFGETLKFQISFEEDEKAIFEIE
ncbi:MAG: hypothetical protein KDC34_10150 [Saprospiraceae bacterium]|nr:hypothetical protein [Saprospiraceae bacterium]